MLKSETKQNIEAKQLKQVFCQVMVEVAQQIPEAPTRQSILAMEPALPHLVEIATILIPWVKDEDLPWVFTGIARFYQGQGLYNQAQPYLDQCLSTVRNRLGETHPNVATSLNNLAGLYLSQGALWGGGTPLYPSLSTAAAGIGRSPSGCRIQFEQFGIPILCAGDLSGS